ncbi:hypothetical protein HMPREF9946_01656 [Acetobacteraceae bacterium AT-5844]|nr:hypothetical protein HMPREF9946_01656 [Acetobacteraceae bacterium AT-5844]
MLRQAGAKAVVMCRGHALGGGVQGHEPLEDPGMPFLPQASRL